MEYSPNIKKHFVNIDPDINSKLKKPELQLKRKIEPKFWSKNKYCYLRITNKGPELFIKFKPAMLKERTFVWRYYKKDKKYMLYKNKSLMNFTEDEFKELEESPLTVWFIHGFFPFIQTKYRIMFDKSIDQNIINNLIEQHYRGIHLYFGAPIDLFKRNTIEAYLIIRKL